MTIYEGAFVNIETNLANENIQQVISVRIYDTETTVDPVLGVRYRVSNNGDGTQTVYVTWNPVTPVFVVYVGFGYNDGSGWVDIELDLTATSAAVTIPEGDYSYSFITNETRHESSLGQGSTIPLEMAEPPLKITVIDNDEDPFTPIKSKNAEIQIYSSNTVDISTFLEGGDNRFYVEIETQAEGIIFKGFLSISDLHQEFLPDPNLITLIATDGLGFLKDEPLVNFENETPLSIYPVIDFIAWCLYKTGMSLDIKVCMNIREHTSVPLVSDDSGDGHFYKWIHLDAKTFEAEIGECEDCYEVLRKILGENSYLTQYKGDWLIVRVDEMETGHEYFFSRFSYDGTWIENTEETFIKNIGSVYPLSFMNDDAVISGERPYIETIEIFKYNYPKELLCNMNFERGEVRVAPDLGAANSEGTYDLSCWTGQKFPASGTAILTADNDAYIKRLFEFGYEKERYIVLTTGPAEQIEGIMSKPVAINAGDKMNVSANWRLASNVGSGDGNLGVKIFTILIITDSGDYYYVQKIATENPVWVGPFDGQRTASVNHFWIPDTTDETQWVNIAVDVPAAPVSGRLFIGLHKEWQGPGVYEVDTYFSDLQVEIIAAINSSYQLYTGQTNSVSQDNVNIKAVREAEVFISDAPRVAMKGALLKPGPGAVVFAGNVDFDDSTIQIDGNFVGTFPPGLKITVTGSTANLITARVINATYSIIGNLTTIHIDETVVTELNSAVTLTEATYILANHFYNAATNTGGPASIDDVMPFGKIQSFDVWNQFNRVMRKFEATVDRTDSTSQIPDLLHKYIVRDVSKSTTNGVDYRIFQLLHYEMDLHLCEWGCFLHECFNTAVPKVYENHVFNYITED